jgi:site-specific recombinase XerC
MCLLQLAKMNVSCQHIITANTEERKLPTGAASMCLLHHWMSQHSELTQEDQTMFGDFMAWVD